MKTQKLRQSTNVEDLRGAYGKTAKRYIKTKEQAKKADDSEHLFKKQEFKNVTPSEYDDMISEYLNNDKDRVEKKTRMIMNLEETHKPQPIRELKDGIYPRPYLRSK